MIQPQTAHKPSPARGDHYRRNGFLLFAYLASLAGIAYLAFNGWDYYTTPLIERPHHDQYWALKPGGSLGRLYGVVGITLMTLMQSYSLRRRLRFLRRVGQLRTWLDFHIYCGVIGPLFIVLHSSLKVTGVVALSFWSMVIVASSGLVGRYLYLQIPRRRSGDEMTLAEVHQMSEALNSQLTRDYGISDKALRRIESIASRSVDSSAGLLELLTTLPFSSARLQWRIRALTRQVGDQHRTRVQRLLRDRAMLSRRLLLWERLQVLFHHWHVLHKPFAIIMYIFAAVHIGVAIATGYAFSS
jgi:hypothetical protein